VDWTPSKDTSKQTDEDGNREIANNLLEILLLQEANGLVDVQTVSELHVL